MAEINNETWYSEVAATFGDRLEAARESCGMSQTELAQRLGVRDTTIKSWEADAWEPRGNRLQMLAGMLNVSLMWLLSGRGEGVAAPNARELLALPVSSVLADITRLRRQMQALGVELMQAEQKLAVELRGMAQ
ncbi:helix-turn-helix domain-containing protein [Cypionkella sp.]|uniref:helix-turn-helix domain-containing protein n=1 Tax=Cypionkella sp. TaxID=2811411 RepID=UPI0027237A7E|nr:helix-turn-helix domain-containing protein [Cypionkella sp.]MDO8984173.1 helix-turn-helix domain-containing protein [Cypionkella sp.]MDP1578541.1 helix-turn-helix domain-containing protein [Cypionkella sp.]MDP2047847.1 helix-turn-helix domain-containing protein [Cypionkella sp.]